MNNDPEMLDFVKALADADRLKIVGVLSQEPLSLQQVAETLELPVRTVFNHLAFLEYVGVVRKQEERYLLHTDGMETLARQQFERRHEATSGGEPRAKQNRELASFLRADGTISQIPNSRTQAAKFRLLLEYLLTSFEPGSIYTEKEVNQLISRFHPDVAGLRRDLVDARLLLRERDGSKYWRTEA